MITAKKAMEMPNDELREYLSEASLNSQDLREMIYRLVDVANEYKGAWEYREQKINDYEKLIDDLKKKLNV